MSQIPVDYYKYERGEMRQDGQPGFATPTGRIELWSTAFNQFGDDPLPYYLEPEFGPGNPELHEGIPLRAHHRRPHAPRSSIREHRQVAVLPRAESRPHLVEINPVAAKRLGMVDGQWCA